MDDAAAQVLGLCLLMIAAGALGGVGVYALIGKPTSSDGKKRKRQIISGFSLGGGIVLGILLFAILVASIDAVFFGAQSGLQSKPLAIFLGCMSLGIIALTVHRWGKYLAGWIGYGILPALIASSSGFSHGRPISRSYALSCAGLSMVTVAASIRFTEKYTLNRVEKFALIMFVVVFAIGVHAERYTLPAFLFGCIGLVLAWVYTLVATRIIKRKHAHV